MIAASFTELGRVSTVLTTFPRFLISNRRDAKDLALAILLLRLDNLLSNGESVLLTTGLVRVGACS